MTITYSYIPNTDTYYFPHKEIYLHRSMFVFAESAYLADKLGLQMVPRKSMDTWLWKMAQQPDTRMEHEYMHTFA